MIFLTQNRDCQAVFTGHTNKINCLLVAPALNMVPCLFTGSSDETIHCYSIKVHHHAIHKHKLLPLPFLHRGLCRLSNRINASSVVNMFSHPDPELPGGVLFIRQGFVFAQRLECAVCWTCQRISGQLGFKSKLKVVMSPAPLSSPSVHPLQRCLSYPQTLKPLDVFECHGPRGVSCLGSAHEGGHRLLLLGSYGGTISVRDARSCLLLRTLEGHAKTVLCIKVS